MLSLTNRIGNRTRVTVVAEPDSFLYGLALEGVGETRCRPTDMFVAETGKLIAAGRALQDFGRKVEALGLEESVGQDELERVMRALLLDAIG